MNSDEPNSNIEIENVKSKSNEKGNCKKKDKIKSSVTKEKKIKKKVSVQNDSGLVPPKRNSNLKNESCRSSDKLERVEVFCDNKLKNVELITRSVPQNIEDNKVNQDENNFYSIVNSENDDWEKRFDDDSVDLDESNLGNFTQSFSNISINKEIQFESDGSSVIEIYDFPEEFKTQDLLKVFTIFINRGFKLRWVDDTHALGIFPSPSLADEALSTHLPFVKTRPLSQGTETSKVKAKGTVLPSSMRPKTCTGLARRLVSSALGIKNIVTPEERQAELRILREAKEQKKLAAKQREAAWEGRF